MRVLKNYESWTGQRVNQEKSAIFFSKHLCLRRKNEILYDMGFTEGKFPFIYLGVLIVDGKLKVGQFDPLIQKISKKIEGWKSRLLSQGGRLVLLRHVLSSMSLHLLSVLNTPKSVFFFFFKSRYVLFFFFLGDHKGKDKKKWKAWKRLCIPTEEGGIAKYLKRDHAAVCKAHNTDSQFWRKILRCIPILLNNSNWKVRDGNVSLWYDKFLSSGPLFADFPEGEHSQFKLKDLVIDNVWDVEELQRLLGLEKAD
ncbi:hypothetical protein EZV62_017472 [Acer yangbiense]|uniref:Uncharacterized protein n=1 Tax=Acer yangbiense TaxID=1000413 RepID=A0A5C7HH45_9ROSI|nr:hypothetical protein EZV62_017472 [Acer yangbiense]